MTNWRAIYSGRYGDDDDDGVRDSDSELSNGLCNVSLFFD